MEKKYSIEIPLYSRSVEYLSRLNSSGDIDVAVYGGVPDSPFNGGRLNYFLDGLFLWDRMFFAMGKMQLARVTKKFYDTVSRLNGCGVPFRIACTNMYVEESELTDVNLYPFQWLVDSSQKHGVRNGVIINNLLLEDCLHREFKDRLEFISSCTKYVSPQRVLAPKETMAMYQADSGKYDAIVLTPQDSRRGELMREVVRTNKSRIIAIANSYCANACNSFHHYSYINRENKTSMLRLSDPRAFIMAIRFFCANAFACSMFRHLLYPLDVARIAAQQLESGVTHFKMGRGLGIDGLERLVALIRKTK